MIDLRDVLTEFPRGDAYHVLNSLVRDCGVGSVLFALSEIMDAKKFTDSALGFSDCVCDVFSLKHLNHCPYYKRDALSYEVITYSDGHGQISLLDADNDAYLGNVCLFLTTTGRDEVIAELESTPDVKVTIIHRSR